MCNFSRCFVFWSQKFSKALNKKFMMIDQLIWTSVLCQVHACVWYLPFACLFFLPVYSMLFVLILYLECPQTKISHFSVSNKAYWSLRSSVNISQSALPFLMKRKLFEKAWMIVFFHLALLKNFLNQWKKTWEKGFGNTRNFIIFLLGCGLLKAQED